MNKTIETVSYVETQQVKEGVTCDIYTFPNDDSKDLAIVTVKKGYKTPLQKVLKGNKTIEGFVKGNGTLTVQSTDGKSMVHELHNDDASAEIAVGIGQIMQWFANGETDLVFYEICTPPYEDGRFQDL